jgi:tetratricopeptide (TPR) repeat protein
MKKAVTTFYLLLIICAAFGNAKRYNKLSDSADVINLTKKGFAIRFTDPDETIGDATKALEIAREINYKAGIGEAYRVIGIGNYYLNKLTAAMDNYRAALKYFAENKNLKGQAKVYNNIGNIYRNSNYNLAIAYFKKALAINKKSGDEEFAAQIYLNLGTVYYHKQNIPATINFYNKSSKLFILVKDSSNMVQCWENLGVVYSQLKQPGKAESYLLQANKTGKKLDLNDVVANNDLTLANLYMAQNKFEEAGKIIAEGKQLAELIKDAKLQGDFANIGRQLQVKEKKY